MFKRIAIVASGLVIATLVVSSTAQAAPGRVARFRARLERIVANKAWNKHARGQVRASNEGLRRNGSFIQHTFRSSTISNVETARGGRHTNFDGRFTYGIGTGGRGIVSGPHQVKITRGSLLGNLGRAIGVVPLPKVEMRNTFIALEQR